MVFKLDKKILALFWGGDPGEVGAALVGEARGIGEEDADDVEEEKTLALGGLLLAKEDWVGCI